MNIGKSIAEPQLGHIAVFYRGARTSWQGHVGLFAGYNETKDRVYTLGGNQSNMICLASYPVAGVDVGLLGFRELNFKP
jgi:hypothetical protein